MSELRKDPFSHRWVVIAKDRAARPDEFRAVTVHRVVDRCPFCAGNEADTPAPELIYPTPAKGADAGTQWQVRVVPNRFPAVRPEVPCPKMEDSAKDSKSLHARICGFGFHEVIIESPNHAISFTDLTETQARFTLMAYRDRMAKMRSDKRVRHVQVFKNVGSASGASIEHAHSQLVALPIVPEDMVIGLAMAREWSEKNEHRCLFCHLLDEEMGAKTRIVQATEHFVAVCPFASRFPYETWVLPRKHASHYELSKDTQLTELAIFLKDVVRRIERVTGRSDYNYLLQSAPLDTKNLAHYHWHFEVFPRITIAAGFEWGTGIFINPVPPEEAAAALRASQPDA